MTLEEAQKMWADRWFSLAEKREVNRNAAYIAGYYDCIESVPEYIASRSFTINWKNYEEEWWMGYEDAAGDWLGIWNEKKD